jgi:hypothetical protein
VKWSLLFLALVLPLLVSGAARAGDEFEDGFKDELGRIAAHEAVYVGRGLLARILLGPPPVYAAPAPVYVPPPPVYAYPYPVYRYAYPPPYWVPYGRHYHSHHHHHHHHDCD